MVQSYSILYKISSRGLILWEWPIWYNMACIVQLTYPVQNNQSILYKIKRPGVLFFEVGLFCTQRSFDMQLLLIFSDLYFQRFLIFFLPIIDEFSPIETDPVLQSIEKLSLYIDFNNDVVAWAFVELDFHFQNFWKLTWNLNIHN